MSSRNLIDLDPRFQEKASEFQIQCNNAGLGLLIYCTYRSPAEQTQLYAVGRTLPGHIITDAQAGKSAHNFGLALDGCPTMAGKPLWNEPLNGPHWTQYGRIARVLGLEWGGDWTTFREGPHVQMAGWKQIAGIL